ncbi:tetratricopeptide repeat protein [Massilia sp. PWRC2]|uniref:tetratricopeptide repeat protein n=1 Tax=Massilia sp. PWRC2 TaxID=2804626 RepID=UPI003CF9BD68
MINLATAATLTNWSKRTLWRRISDGTLSRTGDDSMADDKKTKIDLDTIMSHICIPIESGDLELIESADAGDAKAQTDLAVLFLSYGKWESAIYWLELATKQNYSGSMYWLGRCHIDGNGAIADENLGVMWIAKAASLGHIVSTALMKAILAKDGRQESCI